MLFFKHRSRKVVEGGGAAPDFSATRPAGLDRERGVGAKPRDGRGRSHRWGVDPGGSTRLVATEYGAHLSLDGSIRLQCTLTVWRDGDVRGRPLWSLVNVVDAVAVETVLEAHAECSDADRARVALSEALIAARAPAHGGTRPRGARSTGVAGGSDSRQADASAGPSRWTVTMTVSPPSRPGGLKSVEAVIVDDAGTIVAERTLTDRSSRVCLPLAHAVGAWASLVLDAELTRAKDDDGSDARVASRARSGSGFGSGSSRVAPAFASVAGRPDDRDTVGSAPSETAAVPRRSIELGAMTYLRDGLTATGGFFGVSPFMTIELWTGWVLRPALSFGRSISAIPISTAFASMTSHAGARADLCRRVLGNYIERRGLEADLCAGVETHLVTSDGNRWKAVDFAGRVGVGPSAALRGEMADGIALEMRGLLGANLVTAPLFEEARGPLLFAAAELGVSVRLR